MPPSVKKQSPTGVRSEYHGIVDKMIPMEADQGSGIKLNLYGRSGTGKTTLWATFPGPILAILCSGGNRPGELRSVNTPDLRKKITKLVLSESDELLQAVEYQAKTGKYSTIVLDHATGLQDLVLKEVLKLDEIPVHGSWGMARQQDWGTVAVKMKEFLRSLLNLECNVVIVAQEREFSGGDDTNESVIPHIGSALTPSVTGWLNPACDYVCQTFIRQRTETRTTKIGGKNVMTVVKVKGVDYCLRTAPDPIYMSKFRVPMGTVLPDVLVNPTYEKIQTLIGG